MLRALTSVVVALFTIPFLIAAQTQPCVILNRTLSLGSKGSDVAALQRFLIAQNLLGSDAASGYYGKLTESAVKQWQSARGIVSSGSPAKTGWGVVGKKTRAAMAACSGVTPPVSASQTAPSMQPPDGTGSAGLVSQSSLSAQLAELEARLTGKVTVSSVQGSASLPSDIATAITELQSKYTSLKASIDALAASANTSPVASGTNGGVPCGWRQNFQMAPNPDYPTRMKDLIGPAQFALCTGSGWIPSQAAAYISKSILLTNVGQGGHGTSGLALTLHNRVDINASGVSTESSAGGIDPGDPAGASVVANRNYNIFIVARDPSNAPNDWGLVISSRGCTSGPSATVQSKYPYYTCIDWLRTNASGSGLQYMTVKEGYRWQVAGGTGSGADGTGGPIVVASGEKAQWTPVLLNGIGLPDNTGTFRMMITSQDDGGFAALAPNTHFGNNSICTVRGSTYPATFQQCLVTPDQGVIGVWSSGQNAYWEVIGGIDGF